MAPPGSTPPPRPAGDRRPAAHPPPPPAAAPPRTPAARTHGQRRGHRRGRWRGRGRARGQRRGAAGAGRVWPGSPNSPGTPWHTASTTSTPAPPVVARTWRRTARGRSQPATTTPSSSPSAPTPPPYDQATPISPRLGLLAGRELGSAPTQPALGPSDRPALRRRVHWGGRVGRVHLGLLPPPARQVAAAQQSGPCSTAVGNPSSRRPSQG